MIRPDRFTVIAGVVLLAACDRTAEAPVAPPVEPVGPALTAAAVAYECESGKTVAVQYPDIRSAVVTYEGDVYQARAVEAASGARYSGGGIQWWTTSRDGIETGTLGRVSATDGGVSAILERCSRALPPTPSIAAAAASATPAPCRAADLRLSSEGGDAGAGNRVATVGVQNVGAAPCGVTGYPTVVLLDAIKQPITTVRSEQDPGNAFRAGEAPTLVTLAPQAKGFFDLAWNVVPDESQGQTTCPTATAVRVTPPADTGTLELAQAIGPCGGRLKVGPFRAVLEPVVVEAPA